MLMNLVGGWFGIGFEGFWKVGFWILNRLLKNWFLKLKGDFGSESVIQR